GGCDARGPLLCAGAAGASPPRRSSSPPRKDPVTSRAFDLPPSTPLAQQAGQTFPRLVALMQRLLAPDGCPWDREQSFASLRRYVLEEAAEVADAIDREVPSELCEEL